MRSRSILYPTNPTNRIAFLKNTRHLSHTSKELHSLITELGDFSSLCSGQRYRYDQIIENVNGHCCLIDRLKVLKKQEQQLLTHRLIYFRKVEN